MQMQLDDWVLYKIYQKGTTKLDRRKSRQEDTEQQEMQNSNVPQPPLGPQLQPSPEPQLRPLPEPLLQPLPEPLLQPLPEPLLQPLPEPQLQLQSMNQISQLAAYPSLMPLNNINVENPLTPLPAAYPPPIATSNINPENPLMPLPDATGYSDSVIGLMHDPYTGLMWTTPNLPSYNVAQYYWGPQQLLDGFLQSPLMPPMQPQDESMQSSSESSGFTRASTFGRHGGV